MSTVVWANILLTIPFLIAFIGIPLWLTFRRPMTSPDHAEARAYLRTRYAFAKALTRRAAHAPEIHEPAQAAVGRVTTAA